MGHIYSVVLKKTVGEADYIIGNLESPLINDELATNPTFYGKPEFANILQKAGVNVLNVANNHILEHGDAGFKKTVKVLTDNGHRVVGKSIDGFSEVVLIEENGTKICIAGFTMSVVVLSQKQKGLDPMQGVQPFLRLCVGRSRQLQLSAEY